MSRTVGRKEVVKLRSSCRPVSPRSAVLSTLATTKATAAGSCPADSLVVGFHRAFGAGATVVVAALAVMVALLRKRHLARIEA